MNKKNLIFALIFVILAVIGILVFSYVFLESPTPVSCLSSVDREMTEFKLAIEDSVARMSSAPLTFHPEGSCFSSSNNSNLIIYFEEIGAVCSAVCGVATDGCYILKYSSILPDSTKRKCLNLPPYTTFEVDSNCSDQNLIVSGYTPIDLTVKGQLLVGQYVIRNISPANSSYPRLCVWYKE